MADTKLVVCPRCKGKKNVMALGFNEKKCDECKGIGKTEQVIDEIEYLESKASEIYETNEIPNEVFEKVIPVIKENKRSRKKKEVY